MQFRDFCPRFWRADNTDRKDLRPFLSECNLPAESHACLVAAAVFKTVEASNGAWWVRFLPSPPSFAKASDGCAALGNEKASYPQGGWERSKPWRRMSYYPEDGQAHLLTFVLAAYFLEEGFSEENAFVFGVIFAFVFDTNIAVVVGFENELHGFGEVGANFVAFFVKFVGLGGDSFGKGHEVADTLVAIVVVEVAEVGERATVGQVDGGEDSGEPLAVRRIAAMVFDNDVDVVIGSESREFVETVSDLFGGFFGCAVAVGVDPNGVAAKGLGSSDPGLVLVDCFVAFLFGHSSDLSFAIDHDEDVGHTEILHALIEVGEILFVFGFVFEELIDVFQGVDAVGLLGVFGPVEVAQIATLEHAVVGPLGEGDFEEGLLLVLGEGSGGERGGGSGGEKVATVHGTEGKGSWEENSNEKWGRRGRRRFGMTILGRFPCRNASPECLGKNSRHFAKNALILTNPKRMNQMMKKTRLVSTLLGVALAAGPVMAQKPAPNEDPEFLKQAALMVDRHVAALYKSKKLTVPEVVDDPTFLRRSFLVAAGRIPNLEEARAFLEIEDSDKRAALVSYLMNSDGYRSHMTNYVLDILRAQENFDGRRSSASPYMQYVHEAVSENKPWDVMARDLLASKGSIWAEENGAVGYFVRDKGMELDNLSNTMRIFTGTRMECAQCHDDPFGEYERMDFYHLAAFVTGQREINKGPWDKVWREVRDAKEERSDFGELVRWLGDNLHYSTLGGGGDGRIKLPKDYQYRDGDPGEMIGGKTPFGERKRTSDRKDDGNARETFADWVSSPKNPRFNATVVNRMWQRVMGRGVWEPVDEYKEPGDTVSPALVKDLVNLMQTLDYDLKAFQHVLLLTRTFQFAANPQAFDAGVPQSFNGRQLERMTAEQVWDSMVTLVKGNPDSLPKRQFGDAIVYDGRAVLVGQKTMSQLSKEILAIKSPGAYREYVNQLLDDMKYNGGGKKGKKKDSMEMMGGGGRPGPAKGMARASELQSPAPEGHFLRQFGQSDRILLDSATNEANMSQVLSMMNGHVEKMVVSNTKSALYQAIEAGSTDRDKVRYLYYAVLGRPPADDEMKLLMRDVIDGTEESYRNLASALLSTHEFLFVQ